MTYESGKLEVTCNYLIKEINGCNETDAELAEHRAEAGESGYDADVRFQVFINDKCIDFWFNLFGLDVYHTFGPEDTKVTRQQVYGTIELVVEFFKDKTLDDISEKLYHEIEEVLGKKIYEEVVKLKEKDIKQWAQQ